MLDVCYFNMESSYLTTLSWTILLHRHGCSFVVAWISLPACSVPERSQLTIPEDGKPQCNTFARLTMFMCSFHIKTFFCTKKGLTVDFGRLSMRLSPVVSCTALSAQSLQMKENVNGLWEFDVRNLEDGSKFSSFLYLPFAKCALDLPLLITLSRLMQNDNDWSASFEGVKKTALGKGGWSSEAFVDLEKFHLKIN